MWTDIPCKCPECGTGPGIDYRELHRQRARRQRREAREWVERELRQIMEEEKAP